MVFAEMLGSNSRGRAGTDKDLYSTTALGSLKCICRGQVFIVLAAYEWAFNNEVLGSLATPPVLGTGELAGSNPVTSTIAPR